MRVPASALSLPQSFAAWDRISSRRFAAAFSASFMAAAAAAEAFSLPCCKRAFPSRSASAISFCAWALASAFYCSMLSSTARIFVMASSDISSPLFDQSCRKPFARSCFSPVIFFPHTERGRNMCRSRLPPFAAADGPAQSNIVFPNFEFGNTILKTPFFQPISALDSIPQFSPKFQQFFNKTFQQNG